MVIENQKLRIAYRQKRNITWPISSTKCVLILLLEIIPTTNAYDGESPLDDVRSFAYDGFCDVPGKQ
jgi:hypothetical protein